MAGVCLRKSIDNEGRVCGTEYPTAKWKRRLFGKGNVLSAILGQPVVPDDRHSSTVCSPCHNKLLKVARLEDELKTVKEWISRSFVSTTSRVVPSHAFVRDNPVIKRGIGESPEGKPPSKKQDIAASPLGPVLEGKDDYECRSDNLNCTVRYLGFFS